MNVVTKVVLVNVERFTLLYKVPPGCCLAALVLVGFSQVSYSFVASGWPQAGADGNVATLGQSEGRGRVFRAGREDAYAPSRGGGGTAPAWASP